MTVVGGLGLTGPGGRGTVTLVGPGTEVTVNDETTEEELKEGSERVMVPCAEVDGLKRDESLPVDGVGGETVVGGGDSDEGELSVGF